MAQSNINTDITVNMENLTPEERETLTQLMVKANQPVQQSKVFRPREYDIYYVVCDSGKQNRHLNARKLRLNT